MSFQNVDVLAAHLQEHVIFNLDLMCRNMGVILMGLIVDSHVDVGFPGTFLSYVLCVYNCVHSHPKIEKDAYG